MSARVAIVGLGLHGRRIAETLLDQGHALAGIADPAHAGAMAREILDRPDAPDVSIVDDVRLLAGAATADIAIVTAPVDLDGLADLAGPLLDAGTDVLTIHPDAFDPPSDWAARIDRRARSGGASFASTGVQDVWWVHVPAAAAGATLDLERVEFEHATDLDTLSVGLGELFGIGQPAAAFTRILNEVLLGEASVLGGPMRVLARRLGLHPHDPKRTIEPLTATEPMRWTTGNRDVRPGQLIGFIETVRVDTEEAVSLTGSLRTALLAPGEVPTDRVVLHGDPVLRLEHRPFPGARITDVVPVARIQDIRDAAPGLHTAATLPPATYRHRPRAG